MHLPCMTIFCIMVNTVDNYTIRVQQKNKYIIVFEGGGCYTVVMVATLVALPE